MKRIQHTAFFLFFGVVLTGCVQHFDPPSGSPATGYLVVEAVVNSGAGPATIKLSRTNVLNNPKVIFETGASVQVEGNDNSIIQFSETGNGQYGTVDMNLNTGNQYRLRIKTTAGKEYLSDFVPVKNTPAIDSINWKRVDAGLQVYANTHDPANNTHYYLWNYEETYEYHSTFIQKLRYDTVSITNGIPEMSVALLDEADLSRYICWRTKSSTDIFVGSSTKLSSDVIANFPLAFYPPATVELSVEYSILVHQYAITEDAYNFLSIMKRNTEETGSIFGAQPSALTGNIHCVTTPAEPVIGFLGFSTEQSTRIFILNTQIPNWEVYNSGCIQDTLLVIPEVVLNAYRTQVVPTVQVGPPVGFTRFLVTSRSCVDCTLSGSNQKPSFWP